ncbi:NUDIX domain-containing protein [Mycoplasmatota bacterium WC30]
MEYFDLYDSKGKRINKTMARGGKNLRGEYHLVVHIWIRNSKNQYLIQQRSKLEDPIPFQWAATGGGVLTGETSIEGVLRESFEEMSLVINTTKLRLIKRYYIDDPNTNYITDLYLLEDDVDLNKLILDSNEVKAVDYKTMNEIRKMVLEGKFWDYEKNINRIGYLDILEKS